VNDPLSAGMESRSPWDLGGAKSLVLFLNCGRTGLGLLEILSDFISISSTQSPFFLLLLFLLVFLSLFPDQKNQSFPHGLLSDLRMAAGGAGVRMDGLVQLN